MLRSYFNRLKNNLGLVNIIGKAFGRILFLILTAYFAYALSVEEFANFAIFWSALRLFTFFTANNQYIIFFKEAREALTERSIWPAEISLNIIGSTVILGAISFIISLFVFDELLVSLVIYLTLVPSVVIRNIAEFAKADNSLTISILIEDVILYLLMFVLGFLGLIITNSFYGVIIGVMSSVIATAIIAVVLFRMKFDLNLKSPRKIKYELFSVRKFRLGLDYTVLRGNEVLSNFAVRFLGKIYFGDLFVAYAHIMYQFFNVFALITMAVISGLQSKITTKSEMEFTKPFIKKMYLTILKTAGPFVLGVLLVLVLFSSYVLEVTFPRYITYYPLLQKVSLVGLLYYVIQPFVFILLYNNKMTNIRSLNRIQYLVLILIYLLPLLIPSFNEEVWLITSMSCTLLIQGIYAIPIYNRLS